MCNTDIRIGDKIMYVGNEQEEYFTFHKVYEIKSLDSLNTWGKEKFIMVEDDAEEENYISIPFYKKNFKKVEVIIYIYDDDTFTTETDLGMLNWNNEMYTLDLLINLLVNLGIGYSIIDNSNNDIE